MHSGNKEHIRLFNYNVHEERYFDSKTFDSITEGVACHRYVSFERIKVYFIVEAIIYVHVPTCMVSVRMVFLYLS